jgi:hypothetical protein
VQITNLIDTASLVCFKLCFDYIKKRQINLKRDKCVATFDTLRNYGVLHTRSQLMENAFTPIDDVRYKLSASQVVRQVQLLWVTHVQHTETCLLCSVFQLVHKIFIKILITLLQYIRAAAFL